MAMHHQQSVDRMRLRCTAALRQSQVWPAPVIHFRVFPFTFRPFPFLLFDVFHQWFQFQSRRGAACCVTAPPPASPPALRSANQRARRTAEETPRLRHSSTGGLLVPPAWSPLGERTGGASPEATADFLNSIPVLFPVPSVSVAAGGRSGGTVSGGGMLRGSVLRSTEHEHPRPRSFSALV